MELTLYERNQFKLGLKYSFTDKNKHVKKKLADNSENDSKFTGRFFLTCLFLSMKLTMLHIKLESCKIEDFHELLRAYVNIFNYLSHLNNS